MKMTLNPFAAGRRQARQSMACAYPRIFSLITEGDIALSNRRQNEKCEVFIRPADAASLPEDKRRMTRAHGRLEGRGMSIIRWTSIGIGVVMLHVTINLATSQTVGHAILESIIFAFAAKVNYSLLKSMAFISEVKKLLKSAIDAIGKHPEGMRVVEITPSPATSSDTRQ